MSKIVHVLLALAAVGGLAACTTSGGADNATNAGVSGGGPAPEKLGTEIIQGLTPGPDPTSLRVKASGVFTDTGTLKLPIGNPRTITFSFTRGKLLVLNAHGPHQRPADRPDGDLRLLAGVGGASSPFWRQHWLVRRGDRARLVCVQFQRHRAEDGQRRVQYERSHSGPGTFHDPAPRTAGAE